MRLPILFVLALACLACGAPVARGNGSAESEDFTIDTLDRNGSGLFGMVESGEFTVNTLFNGGSVEASVGLFSIDTRAPDGGRGLGEAGLFVINTLNVASPLAAQGLTLAASPDGPGRMRWTLVVPGALAGKPVMFAVSLNGGTTWFTPNGVVPAPGALVTGTTTFYWNYGTTLPPSSQAPSPQLRLTVEGDASYYSVPSVDTRPVVLASGRVLDQQTGLPLPGATVVSGAASAITDSGGRYTLTTPGSTVAATKAGYETCACPVTSTGQTNATRLTQPDLRLAPSSATVTVLEFKRDRPGWIVPLALQSAVCVAKVSGVVDWKGRPPGSVRISHPDGWTIPATVAPAAAGKSAFTAELNGDQTALWTHLNGKSPLIFATATAGTGATSSAVALEIRAVKFPDWLKASLDLGGIEFEADCKKFSASAELPLDPHRLAKNFGSLGGFSYDPQFTAQFELEYGTGEWELALGGQQKREYTAAYRRIGETKQSRGFLIGFDKVQIVPTVSGTINGHVAEGVGWFPLVADGGGLRAGVEARVDITSVSLLDLFFAPGSTNALLQIPGVRPFLKPISPTLFAEGKAEATVGWENVHNGDGAMTAEGELTFGIGVDLIDIDSKLSPLVLRVTGGGELQLKAGYPAPYFRDGRVRGYVEVEARLWPKQAVSARVILIEWNFYDAYGNEGGVTTILSRARKPIKLRDAQGLPRILVPVEVNAVPTPEFRAVFSAGYEDPLTQTPQGQVIEAKFAKLGAPKPTRGLRNGGGTGQVDLPLLGNVYRESTPALAARGAELMLVYVRDSGGGVAENATDLSWLYFDGTTWTAPAPVTVDGLPETGPQVAFDGSGNVIAVWTRVRNPVTGATTAVEALGHMEIVWARWNRATRTWSAPSAMTDNAMLDAEPQLAGPLADGSVLLLWKTNPANELTGTSANPSILSGNRWSAATQSWGSPATLDLQLHDYGPFAFAAGETEAVMAWSQDLDGNPATADGEVFARTWSGGIWGGAVRVTNDQIPDGDPLAAFFSGADHCLLWKRNDESVMMSRNGGEPVQAGGDWSEFTAGTTVLAGGVGGRLAVVWPHSGQAGQDLWTRVYDPLLESWSADVPITQDGEAEHSPQAVWDANGNLTVLCKKAPITLVTRTVTLPGGGGTVQVPNVRELGATRFVVSKIPLGTDLGLSALQAISQSNNWLPGSLIDLAVTLENCAAFAVADVTVGFYDGDPAVDGVRIGGDTAYGGLAGKGWMTLGAQWTIPAPALQHTLFAKIENFGVPIGGVGAERTDANPSNNVTSVTIGGVDYQVRVLDHAVSEAGAVRAVVEIANAGPTLVQPGTIEMRFGGLTPVLATMPVPPLAAGEIAETVLETPAGTQPEGRQFYEVSATTGDAAHDVAPADNRSRFPETQWVDTDGDGLPDGWETQHGLSPTTPDATEDADHDGGSNFQEYSLATSPTDPGDGPGQHMQATLSAGADTFIFTYQRNTRSPHLIVVETSVTLSPDAWTSDGLSEEMVSSNGSVEQRRVTFPVSGEQRRFFRLRISSE